MSEPPTLRLAAPREASDKPNAPQPLVAIPGYELYNRPRPKITYLIDKLIPAGSQFLLSGNRAAWKSWLFTSMACCVATTSPYLDRFAITPAVPGQGSVLFIQLEERIHQAQRKYQWILAGLGMGRDPRAIQDLLVEYVAGRAFTLDEPERIDDLKRIIDDLKPDLVLWDSLRRMLRGDSNSDEFAMRLVHNLSTLQEIHPSAHGVIAHVRKKSQFKELNDPEERTRGTGAIPDQMDVHIDITRDRINDFATITHVKNRDGEEHPQFNLRMRISDTEGFARPEWIGIAVAGSEKPSECEATLLELLNDSAVHVQSDVFARMANKFNRDQVRRTIGRLETSGAVTIDRRNGKRTLLALARPLTDPESSGQIGISGQKHRPLVTPYRDND